MGRTCVRCAKSVGPLSGRTRYKLKDGQFICKKCYKELGFDDKSDFLIADTRTWNEIKDGARAYYDRRIAERAAAYDAEHGTASPLGFSVKMSNYGQERDTEPTEGEAELYGLILQALTDAGRDPEAVRLVRVSKNYLTVKLGETDVVRLKYSERAKWLQFPYDFENGDKRYIEDVMIDSGNVAALVNAYDFAVGTNNGVAYRKHE